MKLVKSLALIVFPLMAAIYSFFRVSPVLPAVMMDEYFYSIESRFTDFASQSIPNYFFSWVYSSTNACGADFYGCGKALNFVFFMFTLTFIYLIATRLLGNIWAAVIATVAAVSPIHVYMSYFMPESMYFALVSATIYVCLIAGEKQKLVWWISTSALLGLSALVKPHAIFMVPAFMLFSFLTTLRREGKGFTKALSVGFTTLVSFSIVKLGGGLAFAGSKGLSFFGTSYESSVNQFVSQQGSAGYKEESSQTLDNGGLGSGLVDVFLTHPIAHFVLFLTVAGLPLFLSMGILKDAVLKKKEISISSQFLLLTGLLALSFAVVVGAFEGVVTTLGDDHSSRIITRYYEFLLPLLLIAAAVFGKFVEPTLRLRTVQAGILIFSLIFGWIYFNGVTQSFADSVLLSGYLSGPALIPVISAIGLVVAFVWIFSSNAGSKLTVYVVTPLVLLIAGFSSQNHLLSQVGTQEAYFDIAGQKAKSILSEAGGERISIIGPVRYQNFTTKFWIDKPGIRDLTLPDGQSAELKEVGEVDYLVLLGNTQTSFPVKVLESGEGYSIVEVED